MYMSSKMHVPNNEVGATYRGRVREPNHIDFQPHPGPPSGPGSCARTSVAVVTGVHVHVLQNEVAARSCLGLDPHHEVVPNLEPFHQAHNGEGVQVERVLSEGVLELASRGCLSQGPSRRTAIPPARLRAQHLWVGVSGSFPDASCAAGLDPHQEFAPNLDPLHPVHGDEVVMVDHVLWREVLVPDQAHSIKEIARGWPFAALHDVSLKPALGLPLRLTSVADDHA